MIKMVDKMTHVFGGRRLYLVLFFDSQFDANVATCHV